MSGHLFIVGTTVVMVTVLFHVGCLVALTCALTSIAGAKVTPRGLVRVFILTLVCVFGVLVIHIVEAWVWAAVYMIVGEFNSLSDALYFSLVTSTTLGYGDITLSPQWQLLSTFEAMGGLILFGASTAFLMAFVRKVFDLAET